VPAVVPLEDVPGALPGAGAEPLVLLSGEAALPDALVLPDGEPLMSLAELGVEVPVEAVVVGDVVVSVLLVVVVVVVLLGADAVVVSGVVVVLLVVLLRSQPAAAVARTMAAATGIRRFMNSPIQCALVNPRDHAHRMPWALRRRQAPGMRSSAGVSCSLRKEFPRSPRT
jgi:hypothetical protein